MVHINEEYANATHIDAMRLHLGVLRHGTGFNLWFRLHLESPERTGRPRDMADAPPCCAVRMQSTQRAARHVDFALRCEMHVTRRLVALPVVMSPGPGLDCVARRLLQFRLRRYGAILRGRRVVPV